MKAKKSFGQHFLVVEEIAERIGNSLQLSEGFKHVLEVGPGKGVLTKYLINQPYNFKAVEADRDMVAYLAQNYPQVEVISQDFLKLPFEDHFKEPFAIIGNFPYNISSQIVFKMIAHKEQIPQMVGMFQKEMAERVVAQPGSKTYGVISVLTQAYYKGEYLFTVKPTCFNPPPKVQSAVIRLTRKTTSLIDVDYDFFRTVVKTSFSQRRKMLRNTLKKFTTDTTLLKNEFFQQRPERLSVEDFVMVCKQLKGLI